MNILMFTNTFTPHVGGVARSVQRFSQEFRRLGHRVMIVAPTFEGMPQVETDVVRVPAIRNFSGSSFSVPVPFPGLTLQAVRDLQPQIIHSHHPFLLGDNALRLAASHNLPVVFTHHTLYESYIHYLHSDSPRLQQFVIDLAKGYCNLCDAVIAPSNSVADLLRQRGVTPPVEVIPTGVDLTSFYPGDGSWYRRMLGIPLEAFVVGHVGRLAEEKNPLFLARAASRFMRGKVRAHFLLAGEGPARDAMVKICDDQGLSTRLHLLGALNSEDLVQAYRAMDVFIFASQSETQGMVLTEAMATGIPVVAVDGNGVREVVRDYDNGRLLPELDEIKFRDALIWMTRLTEHERKRLKEKALETAQGFSIARTATQVLDLYRQLISAAGHRQTPDPGRWSATRQFWGEEWKILCNLARAAEESMRYRNLPERKLR